MKKAFDAVVWMRERRRQIDEEDRDLSWREKRRRTHEIVMADQFLAKLGTHLVVSAPARRRRDFRCCRNSHPGSS